MWLTYLLYFDKMTFVISCILNIAKYGPKERPTAALLLILASSGSASTFEVADAHLYCNVSFFSHMQHVNYLVSK